MAAVRTLDTHAHRRRRRRRDEASSAEDGEGMAAGRARGWTCILRGEKLAVSTIIRREPENGGHLQC